MRPESVPLPALDDDVALCRARVADRPHDARCLVRLGRALWAAGSREEAIATLEQALAIDPACADAHTNLGNAALERGDLQRAIACYQTALDADPIRAEHHYNLGNALLAADLPEPAVDRFERTIALKPDHAGAHNNLGNVLRARGRFAEALACYDQAAALQPDSTGIQINRAVTLLALHRPDEALAPLEAVLAQQPGNAEAANNLGGALLALDRPGEAARAFSRAIAAAPEQAQPRFGRALAFLAMGRFTEGWRDYEARWRDPQFDHGRSISQVPRWHGEELAGRKILLHAEQGFGDTIQFARYAPLVRARRGQVVLQVPLPLKALLAPLAPRVVSDEQPLPHIDLHCPLLSLPHVFATELANIPAPTPYLHADPERVARFGYLRPSGGLLRVGVAFSGDPSHVDDALRSIPAAVFLPPLLDAGVRVHVLQTQLRPADAAAIAELDVDVHGRDLRDFADTAALASLMDLVISVDTSVAHLAGAMGLPTWLLLQRAADFRWLRERSDSPWYPSVRLFRQRTGDGWAAVLEAVRAALVRRTNTPPAAL